MNPATISEADAITLVRAEARRLMVLGGAGLLVAMLLYLGVSILWLERPVQEAATRALPLLVLVAVLAYFFQLPRWVRARQGPVVRGTVGRLTEDEIVLEGGQQGAVSVVLPRGTTGFRPGDRVWVCPDLQPAQTVAVVVPAHVTSPRPVISARALPVRD
ncbi:hypothetical protein [Ornithinimicrobium pratense]|uniref:Uncharacterized protein n=1 Tax=Ornithinimicrobium pratense TaxID=2593973 RepID=A0A5J6V2J6_9MICO|nr:hypothetical protein [Ornithinimicrobium pratense]QFG67897.1 hypothetical protein FY030_03420 [Ornithinimicrobium pratense]